MFYKIKQQKINIPALPFPKKTTPLLSTVSACLILLGFSFSTAWSYDNQNDVSRETLNNTSSPSSVVVDLCIPLLKSNLNSSQSATDRNQRSVGKVAALSMILGARFALEPSDYDAMTPVQNKARFLRHVQDDRKPTRSAQAIAAYRQCQKDHALAMVVTR